MGATPLAQPQVLHSAYVAIGYSFRVSNDEDADSLLKSKRDHLFGGLMVGLVDTAAVPGFSLPLLVSVATPPPRTLLPSIRDAASCPCLASLQVLQVKVVLGADGPARDQQGGLVGSHCVWMNDA